MESRSSILKWTARLVLATVIAFALIWLATVLKLPVFREAGGSLV